MPAGLPGSTPVQNAANPSLGTPVMFDLISGPKGSPKDNDKDYNVITGAATANSNASTGGLSTGIGFGPNVTPMVTITPNFNDDYTPGLTKPDNTASANSTIMYIGGGKSNAAGADSPTEPPGTAKNVPYTAGFGIGAAGNGGTRDAGAGPAFTGFTMKTVTGAAAAGAALETSWSNRTGAATVAGQTIFGVYTTASAAPSMTKEEQEAARHDEELRAKQAAVEKARAEKQPEEKKSVLSSEEQKALVKAMDDKAKEEEKRIKEEERLKKEKEEGAKLPPITGHINLKEMADTSKTSKKDK